MSPPLRWIAAFSLALCASLVQGASGRVDPHSWIVDRGGYRYCTPKAVFPQGVSYVTICAQASKGRWRPVWSAQAVLTDASTTLSQPAPVGETDFGHIRVEVHNWGSGNGQLYVSGYVQYLATPQHPAYRAYYGCKSCYGGRSRWWTTDGGARWYVGDFGHRICEQTRVGWSLRPRWPAYRASVCRG